MQYCEPNTLAAVEQAVSNSINMAKLLAVEKLLWGHTPKKPGQSKQGKSQHSHSAFLLIWYTALICIQMM